MNIYHYTSIENLALILETKKIRFSNLMCVDDLNEQLTKEKNNAGQYCFVSCWMGSSEESVPMWNMYSAEMKGVRIELPSDMFDEEADINAHLTLEGPKQSLFAIQLKKELVHPELFHVEYQKEFRLPSLITKDSTIDFDTLGRYKSCVWEFQDEWRFRLFGVKSKYGNRYFSLKEMNMRFPSEDVITDTYVDVPLKRDIINQMKIVIGPKAGEAQEIIVRSLAIAYGITKDNVKHSCLNINKNR